MNGAMSGGNFELFAEDAPACAAPAGFRYGAQLLGPEVESSLVAGIRGLDFAPYEFRGFAARRRVASFGIGHGYRTRQSADASSMPVFLRPLRKTAAAFAGLAADEFVQVLVTEYTPGTPIGWHRDRPQYGIIVGVSLLSSAILRFRCQVGAGWARHAQLLEPRSLYVLSGPARELWQHSIPAVDALRYSVTFRTLRPGG